MLNRYVNLILAGLSLLLVIGAPAGYAATDKESSWPSLKTVYFGDRQIRDNADDLLILETPMRAEDAAIVPISIKSLLPQSAGEYIKNIHLIIDENPMPYSAKFILSPELGTIDLSTRIRVNQYTHIRAIAEMNDGSLHMVSNFVKASGGCSAPAGKDPEAAIARLGKMQMRMRQPTVGEPVQAQIIVSHPNYSGLQYDQKNRKYIPAHYVDYIDISYNNKTLIKVEAGISMSEDPSIRFIFTPVEPGILKADVQDSQKQKFSIEKNI